MTCPPASGPPAVLKAGVGCRGISSGLAAGDAYRIGRGGRECTCGRRCSIIRSRYSALGFGETIQGIGDGGGAELYEGGGAIGTVDAQALMGIADAPAV